MRKGTAFFIFLTVLFSSSIAMALDFSADIVSTSKDGKFTGKIFATQDKIRTEMADVVSIVRMDKKVMWVIMPGQNMYMEQPIDPAMLASGASEKVPGEIERKLLGSEPIDGRPTDKYRITYESNGARQSILQWSDTATSFPVKVSAEDGSWVMEYKNLKVGPPDPTIFEVPEGYSKFAMPNFSDMAKQFGSKE